MACCGQKPAETFYRIFHSKLDYLECTVVDKKCHENVTDPKSATSDCHDLKKSLLKEGGQKKKNIGVLGLC